MGDLEGKYARMYRRELRDFAGRWPQYSDPFKAALTHDSEPFASIFAKFGALCLVQRDSATAKAWFSAARDASLLLFRFEQNKTPGWPPGVTKGDTRLLWVTVPKVCRYGRLVERDSGNQTYRGQLLDALPWVATRFEKALDEFLSFKPELDTAPSSNSRLIQFEEDVLLPALFLKDAEVVSKAKIWLDRIHEWHSRIGVSQEKLEKEEFIGYAEAQGLRALLEGDAEEFVQRFAHASNLGTYERRDAYKEHCNVNLLALFLQANEMIGPLSSKGVRGIPADFDVERYWSA